MAEESSSRADDDDMADLFSFGIEDLSAAEVAAAASSMMPNAAAAMTSSPRDNKAIDMHRTSSMDSNKSRDRAESSDSFLELLDSQALPKTGSGDATGDEPHDDETQEILNWLDEPPTEETRIDAASSILPEISVITPEEVAKSAEDAASAKPPPVPITPTVVVALPPVFTNLADALKSNESTSEQIRLLCLNNFPVKLEDPELLRPELYCRTVCGKSQAQVASTALAESFENYVVPEGGKTSEAQTNGNNNNNTSDDDAKWIREQAAVWSKRICSDNSKHDDLLKILFYHCHNKKHDPLMPPVAATLIAALPPPVASVVLSDIIPHLMPLLALDVTERNEASEPLYKNFHLLATYHIPLLVFHLDRYLPGWYGPIIESISAPQSNTKENEDNKNGSSPVSDTLSAPARARKKKGHLPISWFLSHLAGSSDPQQQYLQLPIEWVLRIWDGTLTSSASTRFFLALAVLEYASEDLLLLTGEELSEKLRLIWGCSVPSHGADWIDEWWTRAVALQAATPESLVESLNTLEDSAFQQALKRRQERAEAELQARLQAEAIAHREAQERKADVARERLTRARLVAFYRKHAPEKESNIDKIMEQFAGRFEVLDSKLKSKYGEGFNPALKPHQPNQPLSKATKLFSTMNQGFTNKKKESDEEDDENEKPSKDAGLAQRVSPMISSAEVLPIVCWSKDAAAARGEFTRRRASARNQQLKFYVIDSRPEESVTEQGKFPTAISFSPETMHDPEKLKEHEEVFESLRGAAHLVVMGEGFAALPELYNYKLSPKLEDLMRQDEARTNICALFFVKKGYPFVSILNGGFASAHSWLVRHGPNNHLNVSSVLIDYDPDGSLFGQLETLHNTSVSEKAQRKMQGLLDKSITVMTKRAHQLERLAESKEVGLSFSRLGLFGGSVTASAVDSITRGMADEELKNKQDTKKDSTCDTKTTEADTLTKTEGDKKDSAAEQPGAAAETTPQTGASQQSEPADSSKRLGPGVTTGISFSGLGAALNNATKNTDVSNVLKRNPFARFGTGGKSSSNSEGVGGSGSAHSNNTTGDTSGAAPKPAGFGFGRFSTAFSRNFATGSATTSSTGVAAARAEENQDDHEAITFSKSSDHIAEVAATTAAVLEATAKSGDV